MPATSRPSGVKYPCYWMYKDSQKLWRWVYYGPGAVGEEIAVSSESYVNKADCRHAISLMGGSGGDPVYAPENS